MHTAESRLLGGRGAFAAVLALSLSLTTAAFGQTEAEQTKPSISDQVQELVAKLETRRAELDALTKKIDANADRAAAVMLQKEVSERREKFRRDVAQLVELVMSGEDAGAEVAQGRAAATEILETEASKMKETLGEQYQKILALIDTATSGAPEEADEARNKLVSEIAASTRLVKYLKANIDQRGTLGLDVEADTNYLIRALKGRADVGAAFLKSTKEQIDELATRPGIDQDTGAQRQLAALRKQRDGLADAQRV
ncbi:MAG: hypothetical protein JRE81_12085, partial [Deltaproteobacteria bacterium]|nr:hypothetical protein [Deltaproteobacteria bacterium]